MSASDFVELVLRGVGTETDQTAVEQLPGYVQIAIDQFAHPAKRDALRATWERGLRELLEHAAAGQRPPAHVREVRSPAPPASASRRRRTAAPARSAEGLDLRRRPARRQRHARGPRRSTPTCAGRCSPRSPPPAGPTRRRIDEELAARQHDLRPGAGRRGARGAARPPRPRSRPGTTPRVRDDVPTRRSAASPTSSTAPSQEDVLAPYLEQLPRRSADTIWEDKGVQIASTVLEYMFPRALTSQETLDRVDAWLATLDGEPGRQALRRARAGPTSSARWPRRPPTPEPAGTTKGRTRRVRPFVACGVLRSAVRSCGRRACSASCCTPRMMPPTRSPAANAVCMVSAASSHLGVVERRGAPRRR